MNLRFPEDTQQRIDAQIASGVYSSLEEVLREALDALERRQRGLEQLRGMVAIAAEDVAAGRVGGFDREEIKRDVRARLAERGITE